MNNLQILENDEFECENFIKEPDDGYFINDFFKNIKEKNIYNYLMQGNCLNKMQLLPEKSIDLILTDLPYGVSQNVWDEIIPFNNLWEQYERIIKDKGIIILTATQPFTSMLVMSNPKLFKYERIWEKTIGSGQLNIKKQPLRIHESILVFYKSPGTYNEIKTVGEAYKINRKIKSKGEGYGAQADSSKENNGFRHARSIIKISNPRIKNGHPTQKPLELMEYLIKTYSNVEDVVLDSCLGSGITGVAAKNLNRNFLGIELDKKWFNRAKDNINGNTKIY